MHVPDCISDTSKSKQDQPSIHKSGPQLPKDGRTLVHTQNSTSGGSFPVKIMAASSGQFSLDVLSINAGSYCITISSTTFYFENNGKSGKSIRNKIK